MKFKYYLGIWLLGSFFILSCQNKEHRLDNKIFKFNIVCRDSLIRIHQKSKIRLFDQTDSNVVSYKGTIERRGGGSISLPKYSYEIDLKKDVALAGLPKDDDWILNATYIDKTFLRHILCYELFSLMNPNNIVAQHRYVQLEINGKYEGLYILMEKLDKSSLKIKKSDELAVIFKEPHLFRTSYEGIIPQRPYNFHQQTYPDIDDNDKTATAEDIRHFILKASDEDFSGKIKDIFDIENIIDWHLLLLMSNNSDGILKNFYLYKQDNETLFRVAPWDYDHSFGRDGDNELNLDVHPANLERSILFKRLLTFKWYREQLKAKWLYLNEKDILSVEGLKRRITEKSLVIKEAVKKNATRWSTDKNHVYYDSNAFDAEIDIMFQFIDIKHPRLTQYFENL